MHAACSARAWTCTLLLHATYAAAKASQYVGQAGATRSARELATAGGNDLQLELERRYVLAALEAMEVRPINIAAGFAAVTTCAEAVSHDLTASAKRCARGSSWQLAGSATDS